MDPNKVDKSRKLNEIFSKVAPQKATHEEMRAINDCCGTLSTKLRKLGASCERITKLEQQRAVLITGKLPTDMKPYKHPFEHAAFDEPWDAHGSSSVEAIKAFSFNFTPTNGLSLGELRNDIYTHFMMCVNLVDLEVEKIRRAEKEKTTSWEFFLAEVEAKINEHTLGIESFTSKVAAPPGLFRQSSDPVLHASASRYRSCVEHEAASRAKEAKNKQKMTDDEKKARDKEATRSEKDILKDAVLEIVKETKSSKTKNGSTPGVAPGQNQNAKQSPSKGKGKGTGTPKKPAPTTSKKQKLDKAKGKGKGKGNMSNNEKQPKGKGKGKSEKGSGGKSTGRGKGKGRGKGSR